MTRRDIAAAILQACCCGSGSGSGSGGGVRIDCCPDFGALATGELSWEFSDCAHTLTCNSGTEPDALSSGESACANEGNPGADPEACDEFLSIGSGYATCTNNMTSLGGEPVDKTQDAIAVEMGFTCEECRVDTVLISQVFRFCCSVRFFEGVASVDEPGDVNPQWQANFQTDVFDTANCDPFVIELNNLAAFSYEEFDGSEAAPPAAIPLTKKCPNIKLSVIFTGTR